MSKEPNHRGRPPKNIIMPIKDTSENVAKAIMQGPPKKSWSYLNKKPKS